jgi:mono/diheme cytochrome c family protein
MTKQRLFRRWYDVLAASAIGATLFLMTQGRSAASPVSPAVQAQKDAGKIIYATACAGCHGGGGSGNQGPALVNRGLSFEIIRDTMLDGRRGTSMS